MGIFLINQDHKFAKHLRSLKSRDVTHYDKARLKEKVTELPLGIKAPLRDMDLGFFFDYKLFPTNILSGYTEWRHEKRQMHPGDTIVQQVFLPPSPRVSIKMIFGVRISEIIDEPLRKGYSYETLEGHVEM